MSSLQSHLKQVSRVANEVRHRVNRPMSYAEKVLLGHLANPHTQTLIPGESYLQLHPSRVAMQDASAQTAILQFASTGLQCTAVPASIHCDHYVAASSRGSDADLERSLGENKEVFEFLRSAAVKYGIDFWKPGAGIIHQTVLENVRIGEILKGF
jgi:aconitase A